MKLHEFFEHLKKGKFSVPVCTSCGSKVWPPSRKCPNCLSKTSLKKIKLTGTLLEFSSSHVKGKEGIFGLVEMSGIRMIGSFRNHSVKEGMKVKMIKCGLLPDGSAFYFFVPAKS